MGALAAASMITEAVYSTSGEALEEQRVVHAVTTSTTGMIDAFTARLDTWAREDGARPGASWSLVGCRVPHATRSTVTAVIEGYVTTASVSGPEVVSWPMHWTGKRWKTIAVGETPNFAYHLPKEGGWTSCSIP